MTLVATGQTSLSKSDCLLDSGILVQYLRRNQRAANLLNHLAAQTMPYISVVTVTEILIGSRDERHLVAAETALSQMQVLPVDRDIAEKAALLVKEYPQAFGSQVTRGLADAFIAATAWSKDLPFYTLNTRDFARVPIQQVQVRAIDQNAASWI